eukprot:CAMPEP_0177658466 /NCGR_PEP_ID=MMETSP0447-20121125/16821_1 /TAXON_ID=0 /ORGANISM="Stygamoeba regulata, Strain BSH-02190019" /LENGTH=515 /DNA_ID=CAMNT_0019163065 /DNA_START=48 /DNA_END=1595 /DNA_ORIENTATION=-
MGDIDLTDLASLEKLLSSNTELKKMQRKNEMNRKQGENQAAQAPKKENLPPECQPQTGLNMFGADVFERLYGIANTRQLLSDPTYVNMIKHLQAHPEDISKPQYIQDPRLTQTIAALHGVGVTFTKEDVKGFVEKIPDAKKNFDIDSIEEKKEVPITRPEEAKTKGNDEFKRGNFGKAAEKYSKGVELLGSAPDWAGQQQLKVLHANLAQCFIKLDKFGQAEESASKGLSFFQPKDMDSAKKAGTTYHKLLYRLAFSLIKQNRHQEASGSIIKILEFAPTDTDANHLLKAIHNKLEAESAAKQKKEEAERKLLNSALLTKDQKEKIRTNFRPDVPPPPKATPADKAAINADKMQTKDWGSWMRHELEKELVDVKPSTQPPDSMLKTLRVTFSALDVFSVSDGTLEYDVKFTVTWAGRILNYMAEKRTGEDARGTFQFGNLNSGLSEDERFVAECQADPAVRPTHPVIARKIDNYAEQWLLPILIVKLRMIVKQLEEKHFDYCTRAMKRAQEKAKQ